jgi:LuxR family transcriptional regulator, maltose regulon positive regulatory protein
MRTDADEAARLLATAGIVAPAVPFLQGLAQVLSGDRDGGDASFADAIGAGDRGAPDVLAAALSERSLLAMAHGDWGRAEDLAGRARAVLREARIEDSYITPLVCAAQARAAWHRGDSAAARQQLAGAKRSRPLLTYALPYLAVQARIELARVHLALTDVAAARTLMREVNEILNRRPDLGTLTGEAQELRAQLSARRGPSASGASSLTAAELCVLPLLATHLSFSEIGAALFLSPNTVKSQAMSCTGSWGPTRAVRRSPGPGSWPSWTGKSPARTSTRFQPGSCGSPSARPASWESHEAAPRVRREKIRARSRKRQPEAQP